MNQVEDQAFKAEEAVRRAEAAGHKFRDQPMRAPAPSLRDLLLELARWSRVAERNGDLHARIASALTLDEVS